jgi:TolA-binding protein
MRILSGSLMAALMLLVSSQAFAQSNQGLRVRFQSAPGYAGEGMPYRDCSAPVGEEGEAEDGGAEQAISTGPARRSDVQSGAGLSEAEARALREQRARVIGEQVAGFDRLLASPNYPNRADILFRKAEALRELADADYMVARSVFNDCIGNWYACTSDEQCYEPLPDYVEAIREYSDISRNHGQYPRIDEVIFRLGETLMENDDAANGVQYLTRLVQSYPQSGYIPDAHLLMGEHYFESDILGVARAEYEAVLNFPQSSIYNYAIYKLGWVDINMEEYENALTRFQTVVTNLENNPQDTLDFRNQAYNDMLLAFVEIDNGWQRARDYYERQLGEQGMRRKIQSLANLFDDRGMDDSRVAVVAYLMERYPMDSMIPQWMADTLDSLEKIGVWDRYEATARQFIQELDPTGRWALQNQGSTRELRNARSFSEGWLLSIIIRNDTEARRLSSPDVKASLFREVAEDYQQFFERFGDSAEAYGQRFYFAETLYYQMANSGTCRNHFYDQSECDIFLRMAGDQYRAVVEMQPDPTAEHAHDAALGALQVYDEFMTRTNPQVDNPLPAPGDYNRFFGDPQPLNADAQSYVDIVSWFAELYPEDEQIPAASWRAASLYLYASQIEEAAQRFETIVEHHPTHRFAQNAALGAFVCYSHVQNWVKIERVARRLLEACSGDRAICDRQGLTSALAFSMDQQAMELVAAGDRLRVAGDEEGANAQYLAAAEKRVALFDEFPDSEWSPAALSNAAATFEQARRVRRSIELYNTFLRTYPESELVADVKFTLGLIHASQAEFALAADWFEQVDAYTDFEDRPAAVLQAARLREAMGESERSIQLYEHYLTLDGDSETSREIYFQIANLERGRGNLEAAFQRLQALRDRYPSDVARRVVATHTQADIRLEQGNTREAQRLFGEVTTQFGRGVMGFDAANAPTGWTTAPGGNIQDEAMRTGLIPFAAESLFWQANELYLAAQQADLTYRQGRVQELVEKLAARGEAIAAAERAMYEVLNMGDAEWAVAAAARMGQLYQEFKTALRRVEAFDMDRCLDLTNGDYDRCEEAEMQVDEQLAVYEEVLEDKALERWDVGFTIARDNRVYTSFTREMIASLNDMLPTFRIGGAEGVRAVNSGDPYISTRYTLDLSDKLAAFEDFVVPVPEDPFLTGTPESDMAP